MENFGFISYYFNFTTEVLSRIELLREIQEKMTSSRLSIEGVQYNVEYSHRIREYNDKVDRANLKIEKYIKNLKERIFENPDEGNANYF